MNLKSAVGFSVLVHAGLLMLHPPEGAVPQRMALNTIQVTYLKLTSPESHAARPDPAVLPRQAQEERASRKANDSQVERIHAKPVLPGPDLPKPVVPQAPREPPHPILKFDLSPPPPLPKGATNFSESQFDLVRYKQMIRQHLKTRLIYPREPIEGTVHVRILLDSAGMLRQVFVLQASDSRLAEMAVDGIRSAAPYPRFPSTLKDPQAGYEFLVQYRLD